MDATTFVTQFDTSLKDDLEKALRNADFELSKPAFTHFSAKKEGTTCTLYITGKLVIQGRYISQFLSCYLPEINAGASTPKEDVSSIELPLIGSDETGKGDFFGPLVVVAVAAKQDDLKTLLALKVRDSKKIGDKEVIELASHLKELLTYQSVVISPSRYNELYAKYKNLNHLLAFAHAEAIGPLRKKTGINRILVDQFASQNIVKPLLSPSPDLTFFWQTQAEAHPVVAAASILARAIFLLELKKLSQKIEFTLPKGASKPVLEAGEVLLRKFDRDFLGQIAKLHFKTTDQLMAIVQKDLLT